MYCDIKLNINENMKINLKRDFKKFNRKLPLLESVKLLFEKKIDLSKTLIICVQHLYSTTYALFQTLFEMNLTPQNLYALGKCYSTDPDVFRKLKELGVNVSPLSLSFDSHNSYDDDYKQYVKRFLDNIITNKSLNKFEKIIILDDGGHLIEEVNSSFPKNLPLIGIEQTSSGYNILKNKQVFFPILNLARAWIKLEYESPIIIDLVSQKLIQKISFLKKDIKNILIIGNGILGKTLYQVLKNNDFSPCIFDVNCERSQIEPSMLDSFLKKFDLILGCTGTTSLKAEKYKYLKKSVVLASISSSDREFDAVFFRKQTLKYSNCHFDVSVNGIKLLNSGFPINFDNDYDLIDSDEFQLTRALLAASICQVYQTKKNIKGFFDLNNFIQYYILEEMKRIKNRIINPRKKRTFG